MPSSDSVEKSSPFSYFFKPQGVSHHTLLPVSNSLNSCLVQLMVNKFHFKIYIVQITQQAAYIYNMLLVVCVCIITFFPNYLHYSLLHQSSGGKTSFLVNDCL